MLHYALPPYGRTHMVLQQVSLHTEEAKSELGSTVSAHALFAHSSISVRRIRSFTACGTSAAGDPPPPPKQTTGCEFTTYLSVCIVGSLSRVSTPFIRFSGRGFKRQKSGLRRAARDGWMDGWSTSLPNYRPLCLATSFYK